MAKKLVRIDRRGNQPLLFVADGVRHEPEAIPGRPIDHDNDVAYHHQADLFFIDERSVDQFVAWLARENPGCEIQVWNMEQVGFCPAGDFILKKVTADGILPV